MGLLDKVKKLKLTSKNKQQIKQGIDKVADVVEKKAPDKHAAKVDTAADKLKGVVDKLPD